MGVLSSLALSVERMVNCVTMVRLAARDFLNVQSHNMKRRGYLDLPLLTFHSVGALLKIATRDQVF